MEGKNNLSTTLGLNDSTSPSLLQDITLDKTEVDLRSTGSSGLTMKEYEEQLKKLTAENFNLKLKVYFVEERLSKVTGISDKEDLIKKNIQLKVTCESQLKELEKKQELLFEASKAFELLQKEHSEEIEKVVKEKNKEIAELEERLSNLEATQLELKSRFPNLENLKVVDGVLKSIDDYEKQIRELESSVQEWEDRYKDLENLLKDTQLELGSYELKSQRLENELGQRAQRINELVDEVEEKETELASANFRNRKLEDEIKSRQRGEEIMRERIEEKNKTIESLKSSLAARDESIETLENRLAKERAASQSLLSKIDGLSFQNSRLKEELEILQSRLRRTADAFSPRGKPRTPDDEYKQKYEEMIKAMEELEGKHGKQLKELEEKLSEKVAETEDYKQLFERHKKLEDDHRKACTALKNFIKRSSDDKQEREALNQMLNSHEEVIADLKAQLDYYRNKSKLTLPQDDKLSLAETGDNDRKFWCAAADKDSCRYEKDEEIKVVSEEYEKESAEKVANCCCGMEEKLEKISSLKKEVEMLKDQIDEGDTGEQSPAKQLLLNELETKKCEIEKLNCELKRRNINLQEIVNKELWNKNRQIEKLEKKLAEMNEVNETLHKEMKVNEEKLKEMEKLGFIGGKCKDLQWCDNKAVECLAVQWTKEQEDKEDMVRREAAEICTLLSVRLEELAEFLDSLLRNNDLLNGISIKSRQDIIQALEKSRELSRNLSTTYAKRNMSDSSLLFNSFPVDSINGEDSFQQKDPLGALLCRDKVISEQSMIINKLRDQLQLLNQEIKQRDIELLHCQGDRVLEVSIGKYNSSEEGIEGQSLSLCQDVSDDGEEKEGEENRPQAQETSESEAWSEPDRSVSLARMGNLEEFPHGINLSHRNSKCEVSSASSEETLNENSRISGKRFRISESEIRRMQSKIKCLAEVNENLRLENNELKTAKSDGSFTSRLLKTEEANLLEKLRKTMERLEECSLTCRQLEEKLAGALEKASFSAMELSRAQEKISVMQEEISQLKNEIAAKTEETKEKAERIAELERKLEELTVESEKKISEAVEQREAAERKTVEVECRLKDAENMSREVESRVNEIEKKISETKKFKKETVMQFKEAEKHVDAAEKMMEEAEQIKLEAERKSKDFQSFIDLMRKEVEEKMKEAERKVKKTEREKEELEKQVIKLKKRLLEAEKNKTEVEAKVKEGKETIQCMEEKLKELEVAMDQCSEEAQRKIKEMQKKADARIAELEMKMEEREWVRKTELEKKMADAGKLSKELELGLKKQLEEAEKKMTKTKETAEAAIKSIREQAEKQEAELRNKITQLELDNKEECGQLRKQLAEVKLEASELELELTKLTNEKIFLEEELQRMLEKECALIKDQKEVRGKYEVSIHELENKLTQLTLNKSHLASRLEDIESTNFDLVSRISAIRGKETVMVEHDFPTLSPPYSPPNRGPIASAIFADFDFAAEAPRRNLNSSPDLGIESDPGRFSSLETNQQVPGEHNGVTGKPELSEIKKLEYENAELRKRLIRTRQALEETLTQLSAANQRKKQVERAICKQLHKTHHILKKARVNFESQDGDAVE